MVRKHQNPITMKPRDFGAKKNRARLCFFLSPQSEGLLFGWLAYLELNALGFVYPWGNTPDVWVVYLMSLGNLLCFQSLPLIAFQLGNKIVIHWCLDCSLRWYSTFIPSERKLTLRWKVTLLNSYSQPSQAKLHWRWCQGTCSFSMAKSYACFKVTFDY